MNAKHHINCWMKNVTFAVICCAAAVAALGPGKPETMMGGGPAGPAGIPAPSGSSVPFLTINIHWSYGWLWDCGSLVPKWPWSFRLMAEARRLYAATILSHCEPPTRTILLDSKYASDSPGQGRREKGWGWVLRDSLMSTWGASPYRGRRVVTRGWAIQVKKPSVGTDTNGFCAFIISTQESCQFPSLYLCSSPLQHPDQPWHSRSISSQGMRRSS